MTPDDGIWIDVWLPVTSPTYRSGVREGLEVAGDAWVTALSSMGVGSVSTVRDVPEPTHSEICFAGIGHGEVVDHGRKLVGVTAWRSREGTLLQTALYRRRDQTLPDFLAIEPEQRIAAREILANQVTDLSALQVPVPPGKGLARDLGRRLAEVFGEFQAVICEERPPEVEGP